MIPARLSLRNFMSYGEEGASIDFSGMHLACLSGDNGNGKSALLDAITWALWGKTRASGTQSSGDDDLVRLGAEEMEVTFEFTLGEERYRTLRKRNRRTRTGEWQLHLREADGGWRAAGGHTMRETERSLAELLRMEYETFLNSAYIQQGRADEFTRQKPDDRKRILADILDLGRYDALERMARDHRGEADIALADVDGEIRHLEARVAEEGGLRARLAELRATQQHWSAVRGERDGQLGLLRAQQAALQEKAQRLKEREERLRDVEGELVEREREIGSLEARISRDQGILSERLAIARDFARLSELRTRAVEAEPDIAALREAERRRERVRGLLEVRHQELLAAAQLAESEWRQVEERRARRADLERRLADLGPKLEYLGKAEADHQAVRDALAQTQQAFADLQAQHKRAASDLDELEDVLRVLGEPRSVCPVCQSDLSGGKRESVIDGQQQKKRALQVWLAELRRDGSACKRERDRLDGEDRRLAAQLLGAAALRAQGIEWQRALDEAATLDAGADDVAARLADLRRRVSAGEYGADERAELAATEHEILRLQIVAHAYAANQEEMRGLVDRQTERRHAQLEEADRVHEQDQAALAQAVQWRDRRREQIAAERGKQDGLRAELAGMQALDAEVRQAEQAAAEAVSQDDAARELVARTEAALEDCARAGEQLRGRKSERDRLVKDKQAYTELAAAFGRKGVQALIIENALPEIQDEANRLLSRLTDSALQVSLHSVRSHRSGAGQSETLDIRITDDAGTRPYEMFSGGEAFRVNFALRIALSRLLAHRAGARLQTLIIDEGFGTQDAKGRERLVEAIESIADEFSLILVISHIEELKDSFPVRLEVAKTPSGSQVTVIE